MRHFHLQSLWLLALIPVAVALIVLQRPAPTTAVRGGFCDPSELAQGFGGPPFFFCTPPPVASTTTTSTTTTSMTTTTTSMTTTTTSTTMTSTSTTTPTSTAVMQPLPGVIPLGQPPTQQTVTSQTATQPAGQFVGGGTSPVTLQIIPTAPFLLYGPGQIGRNPLIPAASSCTKEEAARLQKQVDTDRDRTEQADGRTAFFFNIAKKAEEDAKKAEEAAKNAAALALGIASAWEAALARATQGYFSSVDQLTGALAELRQAEDALSRTPDSATAKALVEERRAGAASAQDAVDQASGYYVVVYFGYLDANKAYDTAKAAADKATADAEKATANRELADIASFDSLLALAGANNAARLAAVDARRLDCEDLRLQVAFAYSAYTQAISAEDDARRAAGIV